MAAYPYLVQMAWGVVEKFVKDWQAQPYRWDQEIDVQAEISSRLSTAYGIIGKDTVEGNYKGAVPGFEHDQTWNRVCCEQKVNYEDENGKRHHCFPDIIVWDDIDDPDSPPDNWPVLWACEIKVNFGGEKGPDQVSWDIEKLTYLVERGIVQYACWLNLLRERDKSGDGVSWRKTIKKDKRLWECTARLPPLK